MDSTSTSQFKEVSLEILKSFRISELQALLDHARLSRHGQKRELLQRCKLYVSANFSNQLANKIQQINATRIRSSRQSHSSATMTIGSSQMSIPPGRTYHSHHSKNQQQPIVLSTTPPVEALPPPHHVQFVNLPFFDKMRTVDCSNIVVDWHTFSPLRFSFSDAELDMLRKGSARVFLRIAPTNVHERQNDVLPPYLYVQCNAQPVVNNNTSKTVGAQAHSITFPTDITDKIILKSNASNTINFLWLQSPANMSLKNLPRSYTLNVQLVHCISLDTLFDIVLKRDPYSQLNNFNTEQIDNDSDIEIEDLGLMTTQHRVSLLCPITQSLIHLPTKSTNCSHLTCFDLRPFLQMNERRLQWTCPLCKKSASFDTLRIDKRLQSILANVPSNCSTVDLSSSSSNCQYILDTIVKQEKLDLATVTHRHRNSSKYVDDESTEEDSATSKSRRESKDSDCIVLSSGSESDEENEIEENDSPVTVSSLPSDFNNRHIDQLNGNSTTSSRSSHNNSPTPFISTMHDGTYWEDLDRLAYNLSNSTEKRHYCRRKRSTSTSSLISSNSSDDRRRKRTKRLSPSKGQTTVDAEIITLSSSDCTDNDDQVS